MSPTPKRTRKHHAAAVEPEADPSDPGVLFIRNVPPQTMKDLQAWADELKASSSLYAGVSKSGLALDVITRGVAEWKKARAK